MKILKKIIIGIIFWGLLISNTFALDANLEVKTDSLNNIVNLQIQINSEKGGEIKIKEIKGIENFDIIGQSQSQSTSSSVVIINGKTKQKTISTVNLNLQLKAKKSGSFEIGPATIEMGTKSVKTNSVLVKIDKNNLNILGNNSKTQIIQNTQNNKINTKNNLGKNNISNTSNEKKENINLNEYKNNNYELYILLLILILSSIGFYIFYKNSRPPLTPPYQGGGSEKTPLLTKEGQGVVSEENFEQKIKKIKYPEVGDNDFIEKITEIFKEKLAKKYNIDNIEAHTFKEILEKIGENEKIQEIINLINKAKYSNIIINNEKILEEVKKIK